MKSQFTLVILLVTITFIGISPISLCSSDESEHFIVFVDINFGKNQSDCTQRNLPCDSLSNALISTLGFLNGSSNHVVRVVLLSNVPNCKGVLPFIGELEIIGNDPMLKFSCALKSEHAYKVHIENLTLIGDSSFEVHESVVLKNVIVDGIAVAYSKSVSIELLTLNSILFISASATLNIRNSKLSGRLSVWNDNLKYSKTFIEDTVFNNCLTSIGLEAIFQVSYNYRSLSVKSSYFFNSILLIKDCGSITILDSTFKGNYFKVGERPMGNYPAMYVESYSPSVLSASNSIFTDNIANGAIKLMGGGINSHFSNCTFSDNVNFIGGAALFLENIYASVIENSLFINNQFQKLNMSYHVNSDEMGGGAIYQKQSLMTTRNCTFISNRASEGLGGAIFTTHSIIFNSNNDVFFNNTANMGGALSTIDSSSLLKISIKNTRFQQNIAFKTGGAIFSFRCQDMSVLDDVYFIGNQANYGGAIYLVSSRLRLLGNNIKFDGNYEYAQNDGEKYLSNIKTFPNSFNLNVTNSVQQSGKRFNFNFGEQVEFQFSYQMTNGPVLSYESMENNPITIDIKVTGAATDFTDSLYKSKIRAAFYSWTKQEMPFTFTVSFNFDLLKSYSYSISDTFTVQPLSCKPVYWYTMEPKSQINSQDVYGCGFDMNSVLPFIFLGIFLISILIGIIALFSIVKIRKIRSKLKILDKKEQAEGELNQRLIELEQLYTSEVESKYYMKDWLIKIEDIKIIGKIGEGGGGIVYRGIFSLHEVAMKTVKIDNEDFESNEFERETSILSSMRHPNIVGFYGVCITERSRFMVTEYLSGGSLESFIYSCKTKKRHITLPMKISILIGISNGMSYLHTGKNDICIIHRDLKPGNILLTNDLTPKVCDFGLSRLSKDSGKTTKTTNIGTLLFIAPEMLLGNNYNHTIDVYSFSIIMWQLIFDETLLYDASYSTNPKFSTFMSEEEKNRYERLVDSSYILIPKLVTEGLRLPIPKLPLSGLSEWIHDFFIKEDSKVEMKQTEDRIDRIERYSRALYALFDLMSRCWQESYNQRPSFNSISKELTEIRNIFI